MTIRTEIDGRVQELHVETWGEGEPVVLVHGALATAAEEWSEQLSLAEDGYRLIAPDRRGYGRSPAARGEDFLVDATDIAELMGDGAHLVGHSYGGLGALFAAARRPEATRSLTLLEPATTTVPGPGAAAERFAAEVRAMWDADTTDEEWVIAFLKAVGSDPDEFPAEFLAAALPGVPVLRNARPFWDVELPLAEVAAGAYPKVVVSGGHHDGIDGLCDALAMAIGASRAVAAGAGHEVQFTGPAVNDIMRSIWRAASPIA